MFHRLTTPLFFAGMVPVSILFLALIEVTHRGPHLSLCASEDMRTAVGVAVAVYAASLLLWLASILFRLPRGIAAEMRGELAWVIVSTLGGAAISLWMAANILREGCVI